MEWPQVTAIVILSISFTGNIYRGGDETRDKDDRLTYIGKAFLGVPSWIAVLWFGGFWG